MCHSRISFVAAMGIRRGKGASICDVRIVLGEGGPQKANERNKISCFVTVTGEGVKQSENFADVIYGSPPKGLDAMVR